MRGQRIARGRNKTRMDRTGATVYCLGVPVFHHAVSFYADLHVHSKYSRATSRDADLEHLALWARRKGITVVGTGDFTHPAWFEEIRAKLVPAEPGLFRLRPEIEREIERRLPAVLPRADPLPAGGRDLDHLQEGGPDAEGPPPDLRREPGDGGAVPGEARHHRQHRLGRAADPGARLAAPAGDHPGERAGRLPDPGAHLDPLVRRARLEVRLRLDRRVLRRSRAAHLRGRDRALLGPADELARLAARPLHPGQQLGRPLAARCSGARRARSRPTSTTSRCGGRWRRGRGTAARSSSSPRRGSTTWTATAPAACGWSLRRPGAWRGAARPAASR